MTNKIHKIITIIIFIIVTTISFNMVYGQSIQTIDENMVKEILHERIVNEDVSKYQNYVVLDKLSINVPTVVEINDDKNTFSNSFNILILNDKNDYNIKYFTENKSTIIQPKITMVCMENKCSDNKNIFDRDYNTVADFKLNNKGLNNGKIIVEYNTPITTDKVFFEVGEHSYKPEKFDLYADGQLILSDANVDTVRFPQIKGKIFEIRFVYDKPIRFTEVGVGYNSVDKNIIKFLYQPGEIYRLYYNGFGILKNIFDYNLAKEANVKNINIKSYDINNAYREMDEDSDNIVDRIDNCPNISNTDQLDIDGDGRGDACDDYDFDGVPNNIDNCPEISNSDQRNEDNDNKGDVCDDGESRLSEKYKWVQWVVLGIGFVILIVLFYMVYRNTNNNKQQ